MTTTASEQLRALADKLENSDLDLAVKHLMNIVVPFPDLVAPECGECGWQEEYHTAGGAVDMSDHPFQPGPSEDTPFFSESYLYNLLGKEDARTVLYAVYAVLRAAGVAERTYR